jgi:hypothetical protein
MKTIQVLRSVLLALCLLAAETVGATELTVAGTVTVSDIIGTTGLSLTLTDTYGFTFEVFPATFERTRDLEDISCEFDPSSCPKVTKVYGEFDITFTGANAAQLNSESANWTHGLVGGDALMWVKDKGSGTFETYVYLLPDDTEQFVYWEMRFDHSGGYSLDPDGFPVIGDTLLGGARAVFFDFRGSIAGNVLADSGAVSISVVPEPAPGPLGAAALVLIAMARSRRGLPRNPSR